MTAAASEIRAALYRGDLFLEYLPVVSLADKRCTGAEALVRWRRGSRIVPPLQFIPLIENTPVSGLLTYWVVDPVAHELAAWLRSQDHVQVAINVPPEVFGRGGLEYAAAKANMLDITHKFILEITERGVPDRLGVNEINSRRRGGVLIALDDVCASDAGLLVASQVDVDILKLEKPFVERITQENLPPALLSRLASLLHKSGIAVVAEGVELDTQADTLRGLGIGMAQGWLFSQPLSAADFMAYFSAHH